jgi:hypothetical protein
MKGKNKFKCFEYVVTKVESTALITVRVQNKCKKIQSAHNT